MNAYIFIDSLPERADVITDSLRKKESVILADVINGPHNVVAVLEGMDAAALAKTVVFEIRKMQGVQDVTVYIASEKNGVVVPNKKNRGNK